MRTLRLLALLLATLVSFASARKYALSAPAWGSPRGDLGRTGRSTATGPTRFDAAPTAAFRGGRGALVGGTSYIVTAVCSFFYGCNATVASDLGIYSTDGSSSSEASYGGAKGNM